MMWSYINYYTNYHFYDDFICDLYDGFSESDYVCANDGVF